MSDIICTCGHKIEEHSDLGCKHKDDFTWRPCECTVDVHVLVERNDEAQYLELVEECDALRKQLEIAVEAITALLKIRYSMACTI